MTTVRISQTDNRKNNCGKGVIVNSIQDFKLFALGAKCFGPVFSLSFFATIEPQPFRKRNIIPEIKKYISHQLNW